MDAVFHIGVRGLARMEWQRTHPITAATSIKLSRSRDTINVRYFLPAHSLLLQQTPLNATHAPASPVTQSSTPPASKTDHGKNGGNGDGDKQARIAKARVVFGSRLAGPAERRAAVVESSRNVAGVLVPPRPSEPDNCCMSGCVNCVWDRYRDELEEWAAKTNLARTRMQEMRRKGQGTGLMMEDLSGTGAAPPAITDDDGGGSETNWTADLDLPSTGDDLFKGLPVGILEFMKTEKRLRNRHRREDAAGG
ncbi:MAG: hypothetical protein M1838_001928 [Thelocarpon superellum]|nr:MAG: hypothetical protein M1838_001928 [Thelocarpon superellum]